MAGFVKFSRLIYLTDFKNSVTNVDSKSITTLIENLRRALMPNALHIGRDHRGMVKQQLVYKYTNIILYSVRKVIIRIKTR